MPLVVTIVGATGHVGRPMAEALAARSITVRAIARQAERLRPLAERGVDARAGQIEDADFLAEAFRGADVAFVMIPPHYQARDQRAYQRRLAESLADALKRAGVRRAVALSSIGADLPAGTGPIAGLHAFEQILRAVPGLSTVILRPAYFMENFLASISLIKQAGINGSSARGDVAVPMVARRDIALVATEFLAQPIFDRTAVRPLIGPEAHTLQAATSILGAAIGQPDLKYVQVSDADYRTALVQAGFSASAADDFVEMNRALSDGRIERSQDREASIMAPTTLEQFAREIFAPAYHT